MARKPGPATMPFPVSSVAGGVSQQVPTLRLSSQVEEAINIRSSILGGSGPRTGTKHISKLPIANEVAPQYAEAASFQLDRGDDGQYGVLVTKGGLDIVNLATGVRATVDYLNGSTAFFTNLDPSKVAGVSAGNYMFIAKTDQKVAMTSDVTAAALNEAFIFCRGLGYGDKIRMVLTNVTDNWEIEYNFRAPVSSSTAASVAGDNAAIAARWILTHNTSTTATLVDGYGDGGGYAKISETIFTGIATTNDIRTLGFTVYVSGALVRVARTDNKQWKLKITSQDANDQRIYVIQGSLNDFAKLPQIGWPNMIARIRPSANSSDLDYWVQYKEEDKKTGVASSGYWMEVPGPATQYRFDKTTMPYGLQLVGVDHFTFDAVAWEDREIGSADTIPPPSFVGSYIRGLFFTSSRLGFVLPDGVSTSRSSNEPFNFWRESSTELLDTDPIDLLNATEEVVDIHSACIVGQDPVLFSAKRQLGLMPPQGQALSPRTALLQPLSALQTPQSAPPVPYGSTAFFATPGTSFTGVSQYEVTDGNKPVGKDSPVTDHIPAYIKVPVWQMATCTSEKLIFLVSSAERREVCVYQFLDTPDQGRVQSAWSRWVWDAEACIVGFFVVDKRATMLIRRGDDVYGWNIHVEHMDLSSDRLVGPSADPLVLDRSVENPAMTLDEEGRSLIHLPYAVFQNDSATYYAVSVRRIAGVPPQPLKVYPLSWVDRNSLVAKGDLTGLDLVVGRAPKCFLEMSEPVAKQPGAQDAIYADTSVKKIGPVLGPSSGVILRVGSKKRRNYARMLITGQSLRRNDMPEIEMHTHMPTTPGSGEYMYVMQSEAEEKAPRRFVTYQNRTNDVLVAFENNGPLSFKVVGIVYLLSITGAYTGL